MALRLSRHDEIIGPVRQPFFRGVQGLERFVEVLRSETVYAEELTFAEVTQVANRLIPHFNQAFDEFSKANQIVLAAEKEADQKILAIVAQTQRMQCAVLNIKGEEVQLQERVDAIRNTVDDRKKQVRYAKNILSAAESTLQSARNDLDDKIEHRDNVRSVGLGISLIPVLGWIAGPIMIIVSYTALEDAVKAADNAVESAKENVEGREISLMKRQQELRNREDELDFKKRQREQKSREIYQLQVELENTKQTQKQLQILSQNMKVLLTTIGTTLGRTKVLGDQLDEEYIYSLDNLQKPLRSIAEHLQSDQLHRSPLLSGPLDLDSQTVNKLRMICNSTATSIKNNYKMSISQASSQGARRAQDRMISFGVWEANRSLKPCC